MSLRYRVIGLMVLFTVVLIAAFTALLINRQLHLITENNLYRARVGTFAAKGAFERALLNTREAHPTEALKKLIPLLREGHLVEEVTVADQKGNVIVSESSDPVGLTLSEAQGQWAARARESYSPQSWFMAQVTSGAVTLYAPILMDDAPWYVGIFRYSLGNMGVAIHEVRELCLLVAVGVILGIVPLSLLLIRAIVGPIRILNRATKEVASGNLNLKVSVPTEDELGELAQTFNEMTVALNWMKHRAENTNPLTKLPGNNVIHEAIEKRVKAEIPFVAIYADLDNFKAFNDKYGIAAGDQIIQLTATLLKEAVKLGSPSDFLGHQGGDDFVLLTTPDKADEVTSYARTEFDKRIKDLYPDEDRQRGFILSHDREGNVKQFPLMTMSLAGVSNVHQKISSYAEVTNIWTEVKMKAKSLSRSAGRSSFHLDQRSARQGSPPLKETA